MYTTVICGRDTSAVLQCYLGFTNPNFIIILSLTNLVVTSEQNILPCICIFGFTPRLVCRDNDVGGDEEGAVLRRRNDVVRHVPDARVHG